MRGKNFAISEKIYDILKVPGENFDFQKKFEKSVDIFIKMRYVISTTEKRGVITMSDTPFNSVVYRNQYSRNHYDRITICVPVGTKERMQERAAELGLISKGRPSVTAYLYGLYQQDIGNRVAIDLANTTE